MTFSKFIICLSLVVLVRSEAIEAGQICPRPGRCQCLGSNGRADVVCDAGQYCAELESKMGCIVPIGNMDLCRNPSGCRCTQTQIKQYFSGHFCGFGHRCIHRKSSEVCLPNVLEIGEQCLQTSCFCGARLIERGLFVDGFETACSQGGWCLQGDKKPFCSSEVIAEGEVALTHSTFCRSGPDRQVAKQSIVPCRRGATCLRPAIPWDPMVCEFISVFHGQQCPNDPNLKCFCVSETNSSDRKELKTGQFCVKNHLTEEMRVVVQKIAPGKVCSDKEGCLCEANSESNHPGIFVGEGISCQTVDGQLLDVSTPLAPNQVCLKASRCQCSVGLEAPQPVLCKLFEGCFDIGGVPTCAVPPIIHQQTCTAGTCLCTLYQTQNLDFKSVLPDSIFCSRSQFCGLAVRSAADHKVQCFTQTIEIGGTCAHPQHCMCLHQNAPAANLRTAYCLQNEICVYESASNGPACVSQVIPAGLPGLDVPLKSDRFLCIAENFPVPGTTTSRVCHNQEKAICGTRDGFLECGYSVVSPNTFCKNNLCLCTVVGGVPESSAMMCRANELCLKSQSNSAACSNNFRQDGMYCGQEKCLCAALNPSRASISSKTPPFCTKGQVCLATFGEPICREPLDPESPSQQPDSFPDEWTDGSACALKSQRMGRSQTLRCPRGTTCGVFGQKLACEDSEKRNVIVPDSFCTNLRAGCVCRRSAEDSSAQDHCKPLEYCHLKKGKPVCSLTQKDQDQDSIKDTFLCQPGLTCYCNLFKKVLSAPKFCQVGTISGLYDKVPDENKLMKDSEIRNEVLRQLREGIWRFEGETKTPGPAVFDSLKIIDVLKI